MEYDWESVEIRRMKLEFSISAQLFAHPNHYTSTYVHHPAVYKLLMMAVKLGYPPCAINIPRINGGSSQMEDGPLPRRLT